jgi:hypothetical protein
VAVPPDRAVAATTGRRQVAQRRLIVFSGFFLAMAAYAVLVLSKGRRVRVGLPAAIAFMIGLAPLMSWYELANVPLVAGALALLARDYDRRLLDMVRRQGR